jgi:hypothetical protein
MQHHTHDRGETRHRVRQLVSSFSLHPDSGASRSGKSAAALLSLADGARARLTPVPNRGGVRAPGVPASGTRPARNRRGSLPKAAPGLPVESGRRPTNAHTSDEGVRRTTSAPISVEGARRQAAPGRRERGALRARASEDAAMRRATNALEPATTSEASPHPVAAAVLRAGPVDSSNRPAGFSTASKGENS